MTTAIAPIFLAHAGCPHRCLFCTQDRTGGRQKTPDVAAITAQLEAMLPARGAGEIAFYGGTFTGLSQALQERLLTVARHFVSLGRAASIRVSTRPDSLGDAQLQRLRLAGVTSVEIGCQSFSDTVLERSARGHTAATARDAVSRCRAAGFRVGIQLMPGLPGADPAEAQASTRQAIAMNPDFLRFYPTVVLAGTGLAELWRNGRFAPLTLEAAVELCADLLTLCRQHEVPVIRIGLQPDPVLQKKLLAGPFHPAFGQLVRARIWRRVLQWLCDQAVPDLAVHPADFSDVIGHRGENRSWLRRVDPNFSLTTDPNVPRGGLRFRDRSLDTLALARIGGVHG
ncbi:MAG: radical SAM protein [Desulfuromonadales bacterium]|jgi:histone acetyltransferase (RNA polymerase elongator complex component)